MVRGREVKQRRHRNDAIQWVFDRTAGAGLSLEDCCEGGGIPLEGVRRAVWDQLSKTMRCYVFETYGYDRHPAPAT